MKIFNVLYQFDEKYAPYAGVSITSLFENNQSAYEIKVFVLGEELSENSISRFMMLAEKYKRTIVFIDTNALICKMKKLNIPTYRKSYAANMRLFLPEVLDEHIDRLLYLDADTIVNGQLDALYNLELEEYPIAMALDSLGESHKKEIGLEKVDYYFNSGVILFQMKKWRETKLSESIALHISEVRSHYPSPDQDLLNVVCKDLIYTIDPRYNFQPIHWVFSIQDYYKYHSNNCYYPQSVIELAKENVVIFHFFRFLGEFPWNRNNKHPYNSIFDNYLKLSEWHDYEKIPATFSISLKIERILYTALPSSIFIVVFKLAHRFFLLKANRDSLRKKTNKNM